MNSEGKGRAGREVRKLMAQQGLNAAELANRAGVDPKTVRNLAAGKSFPWVDKRNLIESALGIPLGKLELVAIGDVDEPDLSSGDRVFDAIEASALDRADKHELIATYYRMLDSPPQESGAS